MTASGESYRASPGAFAIKEAERRAKKEEAERAREEEAKKKEREAKEKKPANYAVLHTLETFRGQDGKIELRQSWPRDGLQAQHWKQTSNPYQ